MSLTATVDHQSVSRDSGHRFHSLQPLGIGLVAIFVIAAMILIVGDSQAEQSVIRRNSAEHERDLLLFSDALHGSNVALDGGAAQDNMAELAQTAHFDAAVKRSLYGLRALRLDIYGLDGTPFYSTEGSNSAPALSGGALDAFDAARRGQFTSFFRGDSYSQEELTANGELLQSFALVRSVPPGAVDTGRSLMVAAITTDISADLDAAFSTLWLVISIFFFGSLIILAAVNWASVRSQARLKTANDALAEQYVAVRDSRERMIAAADATKRAIAEELHGSVQTRMFALWMRLSQMTSDHDDGIPPGELRPIIDELDEIREQDIRGLSHRLHPSIVRVGALPALRSLCARLSGDVQVDLVVDDAATALEPAGASPIPESVRLAVFRIAELAIGNTIKHASAKHCTVQWRYSIPEQHLQLIIQDDGVGFDPDALTASEFGGLGIVNIQDYTDSINGRAVLKSTPGWGTTLTVSIPFGDAPTSGTNEVTAQAELLGNVAAFDQAQAA